MNGRVRTVVGVVPPGIRFPENADFWTPLALRAERGDAGGRCVSKRSRGSAPRASSIRSAAELARDPRTLERDHPETNQRVRFTAELYRDHLSRRRQATDDHADAGAWCSCCSSPAPTSPT